MVLQCFLGMIRELFYVIQDSLLGLSKFIELLETTKFYGISIR